MICVTVTFLAEVGQEKETITTLEKIVKQAKAEPGVILSQAYRSQREQRRFFLYQQFTDATAADAYRASANFAEYVMTNLYGLIETESLFSDRYDPLP